MKTARDKRGVRAALGEMYESLVPEWSTYGYLLVADRVLHGRPMTPAMFDAAGFTVTLRPFEEDLSRWCDGVSSLGYLKTKESMLAAPASVMRDAYTPALGQILLDTLNDPELPLLSWLANGPLYDYQVRFYWDDKALISRMTMKLDYKRVTP
jgi:hypothetical protein